MTSPTQLHTDSETSSEPPSNEHTPTTYEHSGEDPNLPRTIITEWTPEECAQFVSSLNLRQYCQAFIGKKSGHHNAEVVRLTCAPDHGIEGEALVALKHDELKEMGIASVGHRLTILKNVYDMKVNQDIAVEPDDYIPPSEWLWLDVNICLTQYRSCRTESPARNGVQGRHCTSGKIDTPTAR